MGNQLKVESLKLKVASVLLLLFSSLFINTINAQVVEETIQLDTITEKIDVIYRPTITNPTTHYSKKIGVFANDTSQIAIEKTSIRNKLNGIYRVYYPSGKIKVKAVFANGNPNGEFTWYGENGIIRVKGLYKDSVKHGFWAYKYLKIYGKYKKGKKHGRWYKLDDNKQKVRSWYKYGKLIKGKGFETDEVIKIEPDSSVIAQVDTSTKEIKQINEVSLEISEEYEQVVNYLKNNAVLRKTLKSYYGYNTGQLLKYKKNYKHNVFQFTIADNIMPIGIDEFATKSVGGKIVVAKIDSILKSNPEQLLSKFKNAAIEENTNLNKYSSGKNKFITVYFSSIINQLMRVEVVWNKDEKEFSSFKEQLDVASKEERFSILLYFNAKKELAGAEYITD